MKVLVVINPVSGGRTKSDFIEQLDEVFRYFGIEAEKFYTTGKQDQVKIGRVINKFKPARILVIGGDGTVAFCARQIINKNVQLGIIPFGSANGMAAELGIHEDPEIALDDFLKSRLVRKLDMYRVNNNFYGMHIGDVGLNARIVEGYETDMGRGMLTYAKHFLKELSTRALIDFEIEVEGKLFYHKAFMVAFANARKYGTGVVLNWKGNLFDGKIELVLADNIEIKTLLLAGMTKFSEEVARESSFRIISCKNAVLRMNEPESVQVDGEFIGKHKKIIIEVIPRAVQIVLTNKQVI